MTRRSWLLFSAVGFLWGVPYLLIKVAIRSLDPSFLVFARTTASSLVLLPIVLYRRELGPVMRKWRPLAAYTFAELALPWLLLSTAEQHISSSLAGLLLAAVPIVGALLARLWGHRERLSGTRVAGLAVGIIGVGALVGLDVRAHDALSFVEMAVVVVCYSTGPMIFARHLGGLPPLGVVAGSLILTAVSYVPAAIWQAPTHTPSASVIWSIVGLIAVTVSGFLCFFALINAAGAARATVTTYVNPAVALVLGVVFLNERFTLGAGIGFAFILSGSYLSTRREGALVLPDPTAVNPHTDATARPSSLGAPSAESP